MKNYPILTHHFLRLDETNVLILLDQKYNINLKKSIAIFDPKHILADISLTRAPTTKKTDKDLDHHGIFRDLIQKPCSQGIRPPFFH